MRVTLSSLIVAAVSCVSTVAAHPAAGQTGTARVRAVLLPFENRTGNAAHAGVASRVEQAVAAHAAEVAGAQLVRSGAGAPATAAASRAGAGLVVRGTISAVGAELQLDATATDAATGAVVHRLPPERGPASDPGEAVQRLAARIAGMLAMHADPERPSAHAYAVPTLAAYRAERRGDSLFAASRPADALSFSMEAYRLDSMHVSPLFMAAAIHSNAGRAAVGDSLLRVIEARQDRLTEVEKLYLTWFRARPPEAYAAARRASALDRRPMWAYGVGFRANQAGYFENAVGELGRRAGFAAQGDYNARVWPAWRSQLAIALHATRSHERELAEVRLARAELPGATENTLYVDELRALAALGRVDEVRAVVSRQLARRADSVNLATLSIGPLELKRHGRKAEGDALLATLADFALANESSVDSLTVATVLGLAQRYDVALPRLARLAEGSSDALRLGRYGVFATFAGQRDVGDRMLERFAQLGDGAPSHYWRGLLTAARGDCQGAVAHFRHALERGQAFGAPGWWHVDPSTEPIWGCEAFEKIAPMRAP